MWGQHWRFAELTRPFWEHLPTGEANTAEDSVYVALSVLIMVGYAVNARRRLKNRAIALWTIIFIFFFIMAATGPSLRFWGKDYPQIWLPYRLVAATLPPLKLSGTPIRMSIIMQLAAAILAAFGFKALLQSGMKTLAPHAGSGNFTYWADRISARAFEDDLGRTPAVHSGDCTRI